MAKCMTPAMEKQLQRREKEAKKLQKKSKGKQGEELQLSVKKYSFWGDAWRRLRRNKLGIVGLAIIVLLILVAIFADFICPYNYAQTNVLDAYQGPSAAHLFGTDNLGRDIFSRCIYATRISLFIGIISSIAAVFVGGTLGLIAAYFMKAVDNIIMRIMDIFQAIPPMLMSITVVAALGTGTTALVTAITLATMPLFAKTVRSAVLTVRGSEYVTASRTLGASNIRLMLRHILPNCVGHVIIFIVSSVSGSILFISMMSYINLGVQPPTPEWGLMLADGKNFIQSFPYMVIFPGLMILITVFAFNVFGDGVRDALDPRMK